jgi:VanZ family protein
MTRSRSATQAEHVMQSTQPISAAARWRLGALSFAVLYALTIVYASLAPFAGWQTPTSITLFDWPRYLTSFDVLINVAAYVPLGMLLALASERALQGRSRLVWPSAVAALLSLALELTQAWLPGRVSSPVDLLANSAGGVLGAWAALSVVGYTTREWLASFRARECNPSAFTDWGLMLIAVWLVAQLNPAIPIFEAGLVAGFPETPLTIDNPYDAAVLMPQVLGIALNVTAMALLISLITHPARLAIWAVLAVLLAGFLAKLVMASMLLKAPQLASSLAPATVIGVSSGIVVFVLLSRVVRRWRAFWATLSIFAGGVMAKLASVYSAIDEALRLFSWSHGQLANFTSLTRGLNEIWPVAVMIFTASLFLSAKTESE